MKKTLVEQVIGNPLQEATEVTDPSELQARPAEKREVQIGQQLLKLAENVKGVTRKEQIQNVAFQIEKLGKELLQIHQP